MSRLIIGCGYLGSRLLQLWREEGQHVFATTRRPERAAELRGLGAEPIVCDVTEQQSLRSLPEAEVAIHAVGMDRSAGRTMREVYVGGLAHVLDALPSATRLVYVSSTSVYGQRDGEEVDETAATEPVEESGRIVLEAEHLLRQRRPDAIILRFAGIYGPGRLLRQQAIARGEPIAADPDKWLNLIHVADGAAAVNAAIARGQPGQTYNVCDDQPVRRREYYGLLAQLLNAPPPRFVPPTVPDLANRRVVNRRLHTELQLVLRFPSCRDGLQEALRSAP
jgi:nucleoside-diphosphate-sugar epimerase